jgi:hypothetical protein
MLGARKSFQLYKPAVAAVAGGNIIVNGTFDSDLTGWTPTAEWTWEAGRAKGIASSSGHVMTQTFSALAGDKSFSFDYEVVSGILRMAYQIAAGGYVNNLTGNVTGTGTFNGTLPTGANGIQFQRQSAGTFYVDNVATS